VLDRLANVHTIAELGPFTCELPLFDPDVARLLRDPAAAGLRERPGAHVPGLRRARGQPRGRGRRRRRAGRARLAPRSTSPAAEVAGLFASQPYLTRFTSSMSADEMTEDPAFAFNPDLLDVNNVHEATGIIYQCTPDGYYDYSNVKVRTPGGLLLDYTSGTATRT
jgi:hypothetical protein